MHPSARRVRRRYLPSLALVGATLAISTTLGSVASAAGVTTSSVLKSASAAVSKETSAHVESVASNKTTKALEKIVADVGATSGDESIAEGAADVTVKVTSTGAYISGNSSGLTTLFGLTAAEAKALGTKWESFAAGTTQYTSLQSDVTLPSVESLLPKAKGTKLSTGSKQYVLTWTSKKTSSVPKLSNKLTVSASGTNLPIEETATSSSGVKVSTTISKWGEQVDVQAPPASSTVASSTTAG
jgi:hypothetical protein